KRRVGEPQRRSLVGRKHLVVEGRQLLLRARFPGNQSARRLVVALGGLHPPRRGGRAILRAGRLHAKRIHPQGVRDHVGDEAEQQRNDRGALLGEDAPPERHGRGSVGSAGLAAAGTYEVSSSEKSSPCSSTCSSAGRRFLKAPVASRFAMNRL